MSADAPSQAHGQAQKPMTQEQNCPRALFQRFRDTLRFDTGPNFR